MTNSNLSPFFISAIFLWGIGCTQRSNENRIIPAREFEKTLYMLAVTDTSADVFNQLGEEAAHAGDFPQALQYFQRSMEIHSDQGDSSAYFDTKLNTASVHARFRNFDRAIELAQEVLTYTFRADDSLRAAETLNMLAGFYGDAGRVKESLQATEKSFNMLRKHTDLVRRSSAYNQMAFSYIDANQWEKALPFLDTAYFYTKAAGQIEYLPIMQLNLGDCLNELGRYDEAETHLHAALANADSLGLLALQAVVLLRLSELSEAQHNLTAALNFLKESVALNKRVFSSDNAEKLLALETRYETREKEQKIRLLRAKQQMSQFRSKLIAGSVLFIFIGFVLIANRQRNKLLKSRKRLARKQAEMDSYVQRLLQKNEQLSEMSKALRQLQLGHTETEQNENSSNGIPADTLKGLLDQHILTEKDWQDFKKHFEGMHPKYISSVRTNFSTISEAEERLFLLLKINLNTHEIAHILGITTNAVKKGRQRLRKRLDLKPDESLESFIRSF